MYNLEQLRMLVVAAELGSFSACARKLNKVQSAVSQGIANLEIDLNILLFDRRSRKPKLTKEGERIYNYAKAVLHQSMELDKVVESVHNNEEATIKLVVDSALQLSSVNRILEKFSLNFPHTQVELLTLASTDILKHLSASDIDLGIMFADLSFNLDVELCFIGNIEFYPVCHPASALSSLTSVTVKDLVPHRQISLRGEQGSELQQFISLSNQTWWCNDFGSILSLVEQNIGWSYLPSHMVEKKIKANQLKKIDVSFDHKTWSFTVDLVSKKGISKGPALTWLFNELKSVIS